MNDKRRELILRVVDGDFRNVDVMFNFDRFVHCEKMLEWLIKNKITGKTFFEMYLNDFKASWLNFGKWIVMKANNEKEYRPVMAGKDFLV